MDDEEDAYLELGNVSPVDLISFAYQIASGMVKLNKAAFRQLRPC